MTAQFVITKAGYLAASTASPTGPHINITKFRVGSGYNYTPNSDTDTALHGATLYEGIPTAYAIYSEDTTQFICELPAEAGPFEFGEIGLYMGDVLFALAAFPTRRTKLNVSVNGQPHLISFRCLIKLGQSPAVFNVTTTTTINLLEVPSFAMVPPPSSAPSNVNAVIVHEASILGNSTLMVRHSSNRWTILGDFQHIGEVQIQSLVQGYPAVLGNTGTNHVGEKILHTRSILTQFSSVFPNQGAATLVQDDNGYVRVFTNDGPLLKPNPALPSYPIGSKLQLYVVNLPPTIQKVIDTLPVTIWQTVNDLTAGNNSRTVTWSDWNGGTTEPMGWGMPTLELPNQVTGPTQQQLIDLFTRLAVINKMTGYDQATVWTKNLLVTPTSFNSSRTQLSPTSLATYQSYIYGLLAHASKNRYNPPRSEMEWSFARGVTRTFSSASPWEELNFSVRFTWGGTTGSFDEDAYFNSGGYIDFTVRATASSYIDWVVQRMFTLLGPIRFKYRSVESMGPMKVKYTRGDGVTTSSGVGGYHGLNTGWKRLFYYFMPLHAREETGIAPGGFGRSDEVLVTELYGRLFSGTASIELRFHVRQTTLDTAGVPSPQRPGFQLGASEPFTTDRIVDYDLSVTGLPGSYMATDPTWQSPNQRINAYVFMGKPKSSLLGIVYPTHTLTPGGWGQENTNLGAGDFAGGGSANT